ncbi:hypothetical protein AADZ91_01285 [Colwelliaceae bacterium 6441]
MKCVIVLLFLIFTVGCTVNKVNGEGRQWDFDHNLQFQLEELGDNTYQVTIYRKKNTAFSQLSEFLIRYAYDTCKGYGYSLEILSGVEGFYDRVVAKSYIQPALIANLNCPSSSD